MLLRTLAVAAVILMLAGPKLEGELADWFGGKATHHIVLLDDSFSMNDHNTAQGSVPIFNDAVGVVRKIAAEKGTDRLTLLTLSGKSEAKLSEIQLNSDGIQTVENFLAKLEPSYSAAEPETMLSNAVQIVRQSSPRLKPVVYFLSDFRRRNWENPATILKEIETIKGLGGTVRMIRAADTERPNLSLENLEPVNGIHAADIDLLIDATVANHNPDAVQNVQLTLLVDEQVQSNLIIPQIPANGKTAPPLRFPVRLTGAKKHRIEARLQPDAVPNDNSRYLVLDVPQSLEILLIVPANQQSAAQYVRLALSPGGVKSGIQTRIESPAFLVDKPLGVYNAVILLDVPTLESAAVKSLENFVSNGGGVAFFLGPDSNLEFVRDFLYKTGKGLFPVSPITETPLEPDFLSKMPDVSAVKHPIFRLFGDGESPLLDRVRIERYIAAEPVVGQVGILATLRDGAPLVLEKEFGKGRTVTFLTTAAPVWNNWGRGNPSYVVVLLELAAYLAKQSEEPKTLNVGDPLEIKIDTAKYETKLHITTPQTVSTATLDAATSDSGIATAAFTKTELPGFYEVTLKEHSGADIPVPIAVNVNAQEGETALMDVTEISDVLRTVHQPLESAAGFTTSFDFSAEQSISDFLLYIVIAVLLGEIFLAGRILPPIRVH